MDVVEVNPLELSLDEIIKLNHLRNDKKVEMNSQAAADTSPNVSKISHHNSNLSLQHNNEEEIAIDSKLQEMPGFGTRPIHKRLGYANFTKQKPFFRSQRQTAAMSCLRRAKNINFKNNNRLVNPIRRIYNRNAQFAANMMTNGNLVNRRNGTFASNFGGSIKRHDVRKVLKPHIQKLVQALTENGDVMTFPNLELYSPEPETTGIPTHVRFSTYFS